MQHTSFLTTFKHFQDIPNNFNGMAFVNSDVPQFVFMKDGVVHSKDDHPAICYLDGSKFWYKEGEPHRTLGPAVEWINGDREWLQHNLWHKEDGPAIQLVNGVQEWWIQGVIQKRTYSNKTTYYFMNGFRYKIIYSTGQIEWFNKDGKKHHTDGPAIIFPDNAKEWWVDGVLHRTDGPARDYPFKLREWWVNGELHRTDGPAIINENNSHQWYKHGKSHRLNGPAKEWLISGIKEYWIEGILYPKYDYLKEVEKIYKKSNLN